MYLLGKELTRSSGRIQQAFIPLELELQPLTLENLLKVHEQKDSSTAISEEIAGNVPTAVMVHPDVISTLLDYETSDKSWGNNATKLQALQVKNNKFLRMVAEREATIKNFSINPAATKELSFNVLTLRPALTKFQETLQPLFERFQNTDTHSQNILSMQTKIKTLEFNLASKCREAEKNAAQILEINALLLKTEVKTLEAAAESASTISQLTKDLVIAVRAHRDPKKQGPPG